MGAVKIHLAGNQYQRIINNDADIIAQFKTLLSAGPNHANILAQLQNYHSDEDGSPNVEGFTVGDAWYDPKNNTGKIKFNYHVNFHFGCSDVNASTRHTETSDFTINPSEQEIVIAIHDKISRDTFDEF
ncbi:MAG: hypothetical protein V4592_16295 [Bacteroidota bacterium]